uniref:Uncharacterized protein n=1 Tax=Oryza glumipatula TaxID=40148 RepID=A0A0E0B3K1_9ORYZ
MVPVGSIECLRKRCRQLLVLIHVNDHRKTVVVLHAGEDGKLDHILVQNNSPDAEASVQSTYRINVSGKTPELQAGMLNDWYTSFRMDTTGLRPEWYQLIDQYLFLHKIIWVFSFILSMVINVYLSN